jgi:single-stranded-DNA-specific exonuclease
VNGPGQALVPARESERQARWAIDPAPFPETLRLMQALDLSEVVASVLARRGLGDPQEAARFLEGDARHDPFAFEGMADATALILQQIRAGATIVVHGDYDVDGVCSTALLTDALRGLGATVAPRLPSRDDGYGLSPTAIEQIAATGARLLITADCGIGSAPEVALAKRLGLDVVVTDHHRPGEQLPECPIVHPALGGYPFGDLCATGVVYKLAQALYVSADRDPAELDAQLDLVALATVADVVSLTGENRALVRSGLKLLAGGGRPGLRALLRVVGVDPQSVNEHTLGFVIGPRINAAGRLYRPDAGLELMLTSDHDRATEIARELDAINQERRSVETQITFEAERVLSESDQRDGPILVLAGEGWHAGVIGIVASRMVERHQRPCVMIALDEAGRGKGSGRSIGAYDLHAGLGACAGHLVRFGGHRMAAGLEIERASLDAFSEALTIHAGNALEPADFVRTERVDAIVSGDQLTLDLAEQLECLRPFGMGNPAVNLLVPAARVSDVRAMGEGRHSRFTATSGGVRAPVVAFGSTPASIAPDRQAARYDLVARLERNEWQGAVEPRLVLRSLHPVQVDSPDGDRSAAVPAAAAQWWQQVWEQFDAPLERPQSGEAEAGLPRAVIDRRGGGALALIGGLIATDDTVAIVSADASRRRKVLNGELGLEHFPARAPALITDYESIPGQFGALQRHDHVVLLDPPTSQEQLDLLIASGPGGDRRFLHLGWGPAEVEFARRVLEAEYSLRAAMRAIYASLARGGGLGDRELEEALAGDGPYPRSGRSVGRCLRVLVEVGLIGIERSSGTVRCTITEGNSGSNAQASRVDLDASEAFRAYSQICQRGLRFLNQQTSQRSETQAA